MLWFLQSFQPRESKAALLKASEETFKHVAYGWRYFETRRLWPQPPCQRGEPETYTTNVITLWHLVGQMWQQWKQFHRELCLSLTRQCLVPSPGAPIGEVGGGQSKWRHEIVSCERLPKTSLGCISTIGRKKTFNSCPTAIKRQQAKRNALENYMFVIFGCQKGRPARTRPKIATFLLNCAKFVACRTKMDGKLHLWHFCPGKLHVGHFCPWKGTFWLFLSLEIEFWLFLPLENYIFIISLET